jgi:hypothetical protein
VSAATDIVRSIVIDVSKEVLAWAIDKIRDKVKDAGIAVDDRAIEAMLLAELTALDITMRAMGRSIDADMTKLEESERMLRASSNVTVVESFDDVPGGIDKTPKDEGGNDD